MEKSDIENTFGPLFETSLLGMKLMQEKAGVRDRAGIWVRIHLAG